jgi:hypothetical protein
MGAGDVSDTAFERAGGVLIRALTGMSVEQLRTQPAGPESNSIGWLSWHLSRVHDQGFSNLLGRKKTAWLAERWYEKFDLPSEIGSGGRSTLDDVRAFDPIDSQTLIGYWEAARSRSREFLAGLRDEELDSPTPTHHGGPPGPETYKITIARVTGDTIQHIGQVAYARGLIDEHGWYGA